jgi:hypothetical protein
MKNKPQMESNQEILDRLYSEDQEFLKETFGEEYVHRRRSNKKSDGNQV